ncbi:MAG: EF-hand domain-containing protein [Halochromatium sp.]
MRFTPVTSLSLILTTALGLSALAPVLAQDSASPGAGMRRDVMSFAELDGDNDGIVTEDEFNQARSERRAARAEAGASMRRMTNAPEFSEIDQNGDGEITVEEFADFRAQRMGSGSGMRPGAGMDPGGRGGAGQGPGMGRGMGPGRGQMGRQMPAFSSFDADDDGLISKDEFEQGRAERIKERSQQGARMRNLGDAPAFDAIDQDGDGQIDKQEFESAQRQRMLEQQRMRQP